MDTDLLDYLIQKVQIEYHYQMHSVYLYVLTQQTIFQIRLHLCKVWYSKLLPPVTNVFPLDNVLFPLFNKIKSIITSFLSTNCLDISVEWVEVASFYVSYWCKRIYEINSINFNNTYCRSRTTQTSIL